MSLKLFGKNAVIYSIGTIGLRATGFLLIPIYTHFLPLKEYGLLATLLITISFMVTIIDFGLRAGLMRFVTEYTNENKLKYLIGSLFVLNLATGLIISSIIFLFLQPLFRGILHAEDVSGYMLLTCTAAVVQSLSINLTSYFRAKNQGMKYMIRNLAVAVVLILSNLFLFVLLDAGIQGALLAYIISYGVIGSVVAFQVFSKIGIGISKESLTTIFKYCAPLVLATSGFPIMETTATYFLSFFTNLEQVGIYNLSFRLASIGSMVIVLPFQLAYEPFLFANLNKPNITDIVSRLTTYVVLSFTIVAFSIVFVFRDLISVISPPEYFSSYYYIFLFLPGMAFSGLYYVGQSLLHVKNKTNITGSTVAIFSLSSVALNYFLIKALGMAGLLIVYNFVWISIALLLMKAGLKVFPILLEKRRLTVLAFTFIFLLGSVYLLHDTPSYLYYTLTPALFISVLISYYYGGFFDEKEKSFIISIFNRAGNFFNHFLTSRS